MLKEYSRFPFAFDCTAMLRGENTVGNGEPETGVIAPAVDPVCAMLNTYR